MKVFYWKNNYYFQEGAVTNLAIGCLNTRRFLATDNNQRWPVFLFNFSSDFHVCVVKYLFTDRGD